MQINNISRLIMGLTLLSGCGAAEIPINSDLLKQDPRLYEEILTLRKQTTIPALVLAEFSCETRRIAWSGLLRNDEDKEITLAARFNIGSNAKSMLATTAARLEEKGQLRLDAPLSEVWPEAASAAPDKTAITLVQLLSHTSGLPAFDTGVALGTVPDLSNGSESVTQMTAFWFLKQPLIAEPGKQEIYSNAGYVVAGAILEQIMKRPFEEIIRAQIFEPLGMEATFGEPRALGKSEPHGHYVKDGTIVPYDEAEPPLPAFLIAAGNISLSMSDYLTYLQAHLCSLQGIETEFLKVDTARRLHQPFIEGGPALGWGVTELDGERTSFHIGGTGDFTAYVALTPGNNQGAVAIMNVGGAPAEPVQAWLVQTMSAGVGEN